MKTYSSEKLDFFQDPIREAYGTLIVSLSSDSLATRNMRLARVETPDEDENVPQNTGESFEDLMTVNDFPSHPGSKSRLYDSSSPDKKSFAMDYPAVPSFRLTH